MDRMRSHGNTRIMYMKAQKDYFKYFAYSYDAKKDSSLYEYRKRIRSEMQMILIRSIHYPIFAFGTVYYLTRRIKSGPLSAVLSGAGVALYVVASLHN